MTDLLKIAADCGATIYRHRTNPQAPAVAFGDDARAKFCAAVQGLELPVSKPQTVVVPLGYTYRLPKLAVAWHWRGHPDSKAGDLTVFEGTSYAMEFRLSEWQVADDLMNSFSQEVVRHVNYALARQADNVKAALC